MSRAVVIIAWVMNDERAEILVSYRRSDSASIVGRIYDRLTARYGPNRVFLDIESIPLGTDFRAQVRARLEASSAVLAVIGPHWCGADANGRPRIMEANDPVRLEIELAMAAGVPVIPVLVEGASMPQVAELPATLSELCYLNAARIDSGRDFEHHVDELISALGALGIAGLTPAAPPTGSVTTSLAAKHDNLPSQLSVFVGRENDVTEVRALLEHNRLVTLNGAGGIGKTRLSLEVAAIMRASLADGVCFVELASLDDGALIVGTVADALGSAVAAGADPLGALVKQLHAKTLLLVFDNCEHIVDGVAAVVAAVLRGAPQVRILASSRQSLGVAGEQTYRLPSLRVPSAAQSVELDAPRALAFDAVALFVNRAIGVNSRFTLSAQNAPVVAEIVRRLDGIPLAIELAASRVKVLDVHQLAKRLDERFRILTGGSRNVLPRQQTLRALIDWSFDLLDAREQTLFARSGIFVDGFPLDAAVAVCGDETLDEFDTLDLLASLVDKSLIVADIEHESTRYRLLESMRAYALEKLEARGERARVARAHLGWVQTLIESAVSRFEATLQRDLLEGLVAELANMRGALSWARNSGEPGIGVAIASRLVDIGQTFGSYHEWAAQVHAFIDLVPDDRAADLARLYSAEAYLLLNARQTRNALLSAERAVSYARRCDDERLSCEAELCFATASVVSGDLAQAEAALSRVEASGFVDSPRTFERYEAVRLRFAMSRGDVEEAVRRYKETIARRRSLGVFDDPLIFINLAEIEHARGNTARAVASLREALACLPTFDYRSSILCNLAGYLLAQNEIAQARAAAEESLAISEALDAGSTRAVLQIEHLALVIAIEGDLGRAARLLGYTSQAYVETGATRETTETGTYDRLRALLASGLSSPDLAAFETEGRAYTPEQARDQALTRATQSRL